MKSLGTIALPGEKDVINEKLALSQKSYRIEMPGLFEMCRLCGSESGVMKEIFRWGTTIADDIRTITKINIQQEDGLPSRICPKCRFKLKSAKNFAETCVKYNENLEFLCRIQTTIWAALEESHAQRNVTKPATEDLNGSSRHIQATISTVLEESSAPLVIAEPVYEELCGLSCHQMQTTISTVQEASHARSNVAEPESEDLSRSHLKDEPIEKEREPVQETEPEDNIEEAESMSIQILETTSDDCLKAELKEEAEILDETDVNDIFWEETIETDAADIEIKTDLAAPEDERTEVAEQLRNRSQVAEDNLVASKAPQHTNQEASSPETTTDVPTPNREKVLTLEPTTNQDKDIFTAESVNGMHKMGTAVFTPKAQFSAQRRSLLSLTRPRKRALACANCECIFSRPFLLRKHACRRPASRSKNFDSSRMFQCRGRKCSAGFSSQKSLRIHRKRHERRHRLDSQGSGLEDGLHSDGGDLETSAKSDGSDTNSSSNSEGCCRKATPNSPNGGVESTADSERRDLMGTDLECRDLEENHRDSERLVVDSGAEGRNSRLGSDLGSQDANRAAIDTASKGSELRLGSDSEDSELRLSLDSEGGDSDMGGSDLEWMTRDMKAVNTGRKQEAANEKQPTMGNSRPISRSGLAGAKSIKSWAETASHGHDEMVHSSDPATRRSARLQGARQPGRVQGVREKAIVGGKGQSGEKKNQGKKGQRIQESEEQESQKNGKGEGKGCLSNSWRRIRQKKRQEMMKGLNKWRKGRKSDSEDEESQKDGRRGKRRACSEGRDAHQPMTGLSSDHAHQPMAGQSSNHAHQPMARGCELRLAKAVVLYEGLQERPSQWHCQPERKKKQDLVRKEEKAGSGGQHKRKRAQSEGRGDGPLREGLRPRLAPGKVRRNVEEKNPAKQNVEEKNPAKRKVEEENPAKRNVEEKNPAKRNVEEEEESRKVDRPRSACSKVAQYPFRCWECGALYEKSKEFIVHFGRHLREELSRLTQRTDAVEV